MLDAIAVPLYGIKDKVSPRGFVRRDRIK